MTKKKTEKVKSWKNTQRVDTLLAKWYTNVYKNDGRL